MPKTPETKKPTNHYHPVTYFLTDNSKLMAEWNREKNVAQNLMPQGLGARARTRAWWKCPVCGHEWESTIQNRSRGKGCPKCARLGVKFGRESFADAYPELAKQWVRAKDNDRIGPEDVSKASAVRVLWKCPECGGVWEAQVFSRAKQGIECPTCRKKKAAK